MDPKHTLLSFFGLLLVVFLFLPSGESEARTPTHGVEGVRFRLDPGQSKFIVHADRTGLAWFKGKSHFIAARNFSGEAALTTDVLNPASLELRVETASLEETGAAFTDQQKGIIKKELDELVLESAKYPEIVFKSTEVTGKMSGGGFDVKIGGDLTLHGVTRHIVIPARVTLSGSDLHAVGEFSFNRKRFNVNATDAFHGFVRVKHRLRFTFDIIGHRI